MHIFSQKHSVKILKYHNEIVEEVALTKKKQVSIAFGIQK